MLKCIRNIFLILFSVTFLGCLSARSEEAQLNLNVVNPVAAHFIDSTISGNGQVLPGLNVEVNEGEDQTLEFIPATGYFLQSVRIDGAMVDSSSSYTFLNVIEDHDVEVIFSKLSYRILSSVGNLGGQISPLGQISRDYGDSQTYKISPDTGYELDYILVDGINRGPIGEFVFENIAENHTISAFFRRSTFAITALENTGGSISPSGNITVNRGEDKKFIITPAAGYILDNVVIDNVQIGPLFEYAFNNINSDHTIKAYFSKVQPVINYVDLNIGCSQGGSVTPNGIIQVESGSDLIILIKPDQGYSISSIKINEQEIEKTFIVELKNITEPQNVYVQFEAEKVIVKDVFMINFDFDDEAISEPIYKNVAAYLGDTKRINFKAKEGYLIDEIIIDDQSYGQITQYEFRDIEADHYVKIVSKKISEITESGGDEVIDEIISSSTEAISQAAEPINSIFDKLGVEKSNVPTVLNTSSAVAVGASAAAVPIANLSFLSGQEAMRSIWYSLFSLVARKRRKRWGNVLDYNTGVPIFQAEVKIYKVGAGWKTDPTAKKFVSSTFTDSQGGFAFIVEPGRYILEVAKKGLIQYSADGFYTADEEIEVKGEKDSLIVPTIAMINHSGTVSSRVGLIVLSNKIERYSPAVSALCLMLGTVTSINAMLENRNVSSAVMVLVCLILWGITLATLSKKSPWGKIAERISDQPVSLALVRFFNANDNRLIKTAITDQKGKYQVIIPKGRYNVLVSKQGYKLSKDIKLVTENLSDLVNRKIELDKIG